jgi:phosphoglycerol transferase MdoB-like AlkP superfamily enzyme
MIDQSNLFRLIKQIAILVVLYTICRLLFYVFNFSFFSDLSFLELVKILFFSIRFDLSVIVLSNSLFIVLYLFPFERRETKPYRLLLRALFVIVNSLALLSNCVDMAYFKFTFKRTNATVFNFFTGEIGNDLFQLIPVFIKDYWYLFIIWAFLVVALIYLYNKIEVIRLSRWRWSDYFRQSFIFILSAGIALIIYRGGVQLKPINCATAGEYTSVKNIPLMISTPFSILKTIDIKAIEPSGEWSFLSANELKKIVDPIHHPGNEEFKKINVCVIILESFSKEYIGALNGKAIGYTPFLDSLINESLTFTNAFSNGKTSIDGVPSIVASIPSWMNESFITSPYSTNQINTLPNTLKNKGYSTSFFHGGTNGTMGFDAFCKLAGYDHYYGRSEYNNEKDFDGSWGIWDEEFLQYSVKTISKTPRPFLATIFTLSSHHPFCVPDKHKNKFKQGKLPIERCVSYSDYALKEFFESAKKTAWYNNTLFVLTADHTGVSGDAFYSNNIGNFSIPIIYFLPGSNLKGKDSTVTQQIDIMPSVLDYLNYPLPYFSFGKSVFDSTANHYALTFNSGVFHLIKKDYALGFDGNKAVDLYHYKTDSMLTKNLLISEPFVAKQMDKEVKALIQSYQQNLMNNTTYYIKKPF